MRFRYLSVMILLLVMTGLPFIGGAQLTDRAVDDAMRFFIEQIGSLPEASPTLETYKAHLGLSDSDFAVLAQEARSLRTRDIQREAEAEAIIAEQAGKGFAGAAGRFEGIRSDRDNDLLTTTASILRTMSQEGSNRLRERFLREAQHRPPSRQ